MTNRFIVNLQVAALHGTESSTADPVSTLQFRTRTERILHSVSGNMDPYGYEEAHETAALDTANCPDTFGGESGSLDRSEQLDLAEAPVPVPQRDEEKVCSTSSTTWLGSVSSRVLTSCSCVHRSCPPHRPWRTCNLEKVPRTGPDDTQVDVQAVEAEQTRQES
ncbi:hypothetical protein BD413DRAFT_251441 [Trametes elegans]|nr:hypothetical protein BD413DRAFT_251441 [Trametes elegans]